MCGRSYRTGIKPSPTALAAQSTHSLNQQGIPATLGFSNTSITLFYFALSLSLPREADSHGNKVIILQS